jgi:hypothetical protein
MGKAGGGVDVGCSHFFSAESWVFRATFASTWVFWKKCNFQIPAEWYEAKQIYSHGPEICFQRFAANFPHGRICSPLMTKWVSRHHW